MLNKKVFLIQRMTNVMSDVKDILKKAESAFFEGDYKTAYEIWKPLAEQENAEAQNNLGKMYELGQGVKQGYEEAVKWYCLAAEKGNAKAQNNLGLMYKEGKGVEQDYEEAKRWFLLSGNQGLNAAKNNLSRITGSGTLYFDDEDFINIDIRDYDNAYPLLLMLVEQEDADPQFQFNLGLMYGTGLGVELDIGEAVKWYRLAAEQGHAKAQEILELLFGEN